MRTHDPSLPLVSIVSPAYNEEKYLTECVESILAQTYTNWDYTIVNNCSKDRTLEVAQEYAARDPRIRVITTDSFLPAVANLNFAMRQISPTSKYCKVLLADDWMFPECLERMVAVMEQHPSVGIAGAYGIANQWVVWSGLPYPSNVVSGREICRQRLLGGPYVFGSPSSVLFRSNLVRGHERFYNESNMHADSEACFELLKKCDFGFIHQVLTFSRDFRPGSLLETSRRLNSDAARAVHELISFGPFYLSPEEYRSSLNATLSKYYDFLASSLLQRRDREFWDFHKQKLQEEGLEFKYSRVVYCLGKRILRRLRFTPDKSRAPQWGLP